MLLLFFREADKVVLYGAVICYTMIIHFISICILLLAIVIVPKYTVYENTARA